MTFRSKWAHPWQKPQKHGSKYRIKIGTNWVSFDSFDEANKTSKERNKNKTIASYEKRMSDGEVITSIDTRIAVQQYLDSLTASNKRENYVRQIGFRLLPIMDVAKIEMISPILITNIILKNKKMESKCKFFVKALKAFLRWAKDKSGYKIDEKSLLVETPTVDEKPKRLLTDDEISKLLVAAAGTESDHRMYPKIGYDRITLMLEFLSKFGLRPTEFWNLKVSHLNFTTSVLSLPPSITKTRRGRSFPITQKYVEQIKKCGKDLENPDAPLFVNPKGVAWNWSYMKKDITFAAAKAGIGKVQLYFLRHYAAVRMFMKCHDWKMVCDFMGHGLQIAFKVYQQRTQDAMQKLAEVL